MEKLGGLSIIAWIGILTAIFLIVVYSKGTATSAGALFSGTKSLVGQLQGNPGQSVLSKAA